MNWCYRVFHWLNQDNLAYLLVLNALLYDKIQSKSDFYKELINIGPEIKVAQ